MKKITLALLLITSLYAIDQDKQKHIAAGLFVYVGCELVNYIADIDYINHETCIASVFAAGIGKEVYDSLGNGHVEIMDAVATVAVPMVSYTLITW